MDNLNAVLDDMMTNKRIGDGTVDAKRILQAVIDDLKARDRVLAENYALLMKQGNTEVAIMIDKRRLEIDKIIKELQAAMGRLS